MDGTDQPQLHLALAEPAGLALHRDRGDPALTVLDRVHRQPDHVLGGGDDDPHADAHAGTQVLCLVYGSDHGERDYPSGVAPAESNIDDLAAVPSPTERVRTDE